ncbi:hypothetical protein BIW11_07172 [Tropilaelaps mercedesae]|uniref:Centrosomal protein 43 n=1 Tax=Tropilaelaps mercedesae TaxID=418985 RepID=A0A1V9XVD9_9ACAR|nr:hypothetical protein BIW11_07172 [Tropilaelaps mercedesae]
MALNNEEADLELRDVVLQVLNESGTLSKIKASTWMEWLRKVQAELRYRVFQALYDSKQLRERVPPSRALQFIAGSESTESRLVFSLVKDFLEQLDLSFTLSVFAAELGEPEGLLSRRETAAAFHVDSTGGEPLIFSLVHSALGDREHVRSDTLVRRSSTQLEATDMKNMFAEQSFFAQLDKRNDVEKAGQNDKHVGCDSSKHITITTKTTVPKMVDPVEDLKENPPLNGWGPANKDMRDNNKIDMTISPPHSPEKAITGIQEPFSGKLSLLKPLSPLNDLPQPQAPTKLPSLRRLPPEPVKPLEGDSGDDVESLGEDLLASLGSDSATATLEMSTSLAEIPGGDYVENTASVR